MLMLMLVSEATEKEAAIAKTGGGTRNVQTGTSVALAGKESIVAVQRVTSAPTEKTQ